MPIETDHHTPWGRERYRFRPWHERPLTNGQLRVILGASWSVAAVVVVVCGIAVWLAGWPARWLVEPIVLVVIALLVVAGRDALSDVPADLGGEP